MEEERIREIFNHITQNTGRDFITSDELAKFYPMMGCNGKRLRFHVNHSGLKASGRVRKQKPKTRSYSKAPAEMSPLVMICRFRGNYGACV